MIRTSDDSDRRPPSRRPRGFTLAEVLAVVSIFSVFAALAIIAVSRNQGSSELDRFAAAIASQVNVARRRAVETSRTYLVDVRAGSVSYCEKDPATPAQAACPSPSPLESSPLFMAGTEARVVSWAGDVDVGQGLTRTAIGAGKALTILPSGSCYANPGATIPNGFTVYLRGVTDDTKLRKVIVYPLAARPRVVDQW